ncbi:protein disulfide-isomerase [Megalops cyprinoides]|uniref:protein disulfide-isomerase n=1 Tax=Megalops cyprinoides TaxID=118141 RepID=UPI001863B1E8|nr:protein disulfide-isomerase [Megalops cyprinoides]
MKELLISLLALACFCGAVAEDLAQDNIKTKAKKTKTIPIKEEKGVLILKKSNFDQALKQHKQLLVNFHAPLSGESQSLSVEFTKAAAHLKAESFKVQLGVVDVSKEKDLAKELNVTGFSPPRLYISGDKQNPVICPVLKKASSIVTWLKRRTGRRAELIKDLGQVEMFVAVEDMVVLGFFKDLEKGGVEAFYATAADMPDLPFGVTKNKHVLSKYEITKETVVLFKESKKSEEYEISSDVSKEDLIRFIRVHEMDLVTEYNGTTSGKILNSVLTNHAVLFANKSDGSFREIYGEFERAASGFKGKALFVFIDTDEHRNGRILEYFRVREVEAPLVRMVNLTDNVQYQMQSEEVTSDAVKAFCQTYIDGKAKPKLQSEPIPKDWDKQPVKELVGSNFEKVAFNEDRNVFIMFYAPWYKECQEFFQLWEKLAKVYEKHESVVIARIDATANDINVVLQERYPSFKFFPAVFSEKVVPFLGERTLEALVQFVEDQVELAKEDKAKEEKERKKYIEAQKANERAKEEL